MKKDLRKVTAIALMGTMIVGMSTGCSKKEDTKDANAAATTAPTEAAKTDDSAATTTPTEAAETTETSAPATDASEYLLPEVTSRFLNQSEVESFSLDQLQLAINEIFARHGRCFKTAEIDSYFRSKSWYQPDASKTDEQIVAEFNEYEKANEELLEKVREAKQN